MHKFTFDSSESINYSNQMDLTNSNYLEIYNKLDEKKKAFDQMSVFRAQ